MARLIYLLNTSLDGRIADETGSTDWTTPDEEFLTLINDLTRPVGTYLYGRRLYELMRVWETDPALPRTPAEREFAAIWQAADKVVFSRTLDAPTTVRTRLERDVVPEAVRRLKATAERDLTVGGPTLAAEALAAGLVDEVRLIVWPVVVGNGPRFFPDRARLRLALTDEHRLGNGAVSLRYRVLA